MDTHSSYKNRPKARGFWGNTYYGKIRGSSSFVSHKLGAS